MISWLASVHATAARVHRHVGGDTLTLGRWRLEQPLPAVLEPDLNRSRRHAQLLRESRSIVKARERILLKVLREQHQLQP